MLTADVIISNRLGLHARPASKLVKIASTSNSKVRLIKGDDKVNARSILGVMMLQAIQGSKLTIEVDGDDERDVLDRIITLIRNKFDED